MIRAIVIAAMIAVAGSADAQVLPDIDIKAHCNEVGGGKKRIATCVASENYARLWLESRRIDPRPSMPVAIRWTFAGPAMCSSAVA